MNCWSFSSTSTSLSDCSVYLMLGYKHRSECAWSFQLHLVDLMSDHEPKRNILFVYPPNNACFNQLDSQLNFVQSDEELLFLEFQWCNTHELEAILNQLALVVPDCVEVKSHVMDQIAFNSNDTLISDNTAPTIINSYSSMSLQR